MAKIGDIKRGRMTGKIYGIIQNGKTLHKYQVYRKGMLQGWLVGESPEAICKLFKWELEDCQFQKEALSPWDYLGKSIKIVKEEVK